MPDRTTPTTYYVAACGGRKLTHPAPAGELYVGSARMIIDAVRAEAARDDDDATVLILSALHGLVPVDKVLEPYDVCMGGPGSITTAQLAAQVADLDGNASGAIFYAFLPAAYRRALEAAVEIVCDAADDDIATVQDVFEAAPGIGYQRGVAASLARSSHLCPPWSSDEDPIAAPAAARPVRWRHRCADLPAAV